MTASIQYRYDQLQFSSLIPNFTNIDRVTASLPCSGTIANGSGQNFIVNVTLSSLNTFSDVYAINQNTGKKTLLNNNVAIDPVWQFTSFETVQNSVSYLGSIVTVEISVSNFTGGPITLVSQTYTIEIIEYELPI